MASAHRLSIWTSLSGAAVRDVLNLQSGNPTNSTKIGDFLNRIANGDYNAKIRANVGGVAATNSVLFHSFAQDDTVTVNGVVFTGRNTPSTSSQFAVGSSDEACANNFFTKVKNSALDLVVGVVGVSRSGTITLSDFAAADTIVVQNVTFTCETTADPADIYQFQIGADATGTAQNFVRQLNLAASLNPLLSTVNSSNASNVITLTALTTLTISVVSLAGTTTVANATVPMVCLIPGQIGNLCTLAISHNGSVGAAAFSGGTEGTEYTLSNYATY